VCNKNANYIGDTCSPQSITLRSCVTTIAASYKLMHELNTRAATKYDSGNKAHERKLLELWDLAMPNEKLTSRISEQWTTIGFQGVDPATDFRGMGRCRMFVPAICVLRVRWLTFFKGLLGLDDLHYYAKVHSQSFQRVLKSSQHETAWYVTTIPI
jgi:hypothetical protein